MILIKPSEVNLGQLSQNEVKEFEVELSNLSEQSLEVTPWASCGCTVPRVDPKVIPSGGTGRLIAKFDTSGKSGLQQKTIGVKYDIGGQTKTTSINFIAKI